MRAVDQCAGGRRYTLIGPATDATDATASTPRAGGQTAPQLPPLERQCLTARRRACWRPACPAAGRAYGLPGDWPACLARGAGAALVRCMSGRPPPSGHQLNKIAILFRLPPKKWTF